MNHPNNMPFISFVTKLGNSIPCLNLPPHLSCRPNAPCAKLCYAKHGRFNTENCQNRMMQNWNILQEDREFFWAYVFRYFSAYARARLFSAGDVPSYEDFSEIVHNAEKYPNTKVLLFTKQYEIVNSYADKYAIPPNLQIIFSCWGEWCPPNPHNFPTSHVRFKKKRGKPNPMNARIPADAHECPGFCGNCHEGSCWNLCGGESVVFDKH